MIAIELRDKHNESLLLAHSESNEDQKVLWLLEK